MAGGFSVNRPKLVAFARYRWDKVREQHHIVYPEGVLVLNETGARIVQLLDGRSFEELVTELRSVFNSTDVADDVREYLKGLYDHGLLTDDDA